MTMFWKYNTSTSSQIDSLLTKEDVTLQEVMDSEDIINECRVQNKNLIDFLLKPHVIDELVTLTTHEPSVEIEERNRFKYPNIASELLTCDVPAINERLASDAMLLEKLYIFLESEPPLNSLLASYFSKIMGALIAKKTEQVLDFLKAKDTFLPLLLKHLGTSAVMDLMLKLMTQVEGVEMRQNILNWLDSQRIMQQLVALLNPKVEKEKHDNVAQLLCDFIRIARDSLRNSTERADPDPLLNTLESQDTVCLLLSQIFGEEKCESAIVGGIQVLLALLDVNQSSIPKNSVQNMYNSNINDEAMDMEQKQKIISNTTEAICTRIKDFHDLLLDPPKQSSLETTAGTLDPPLGNARLHVIKLLAAVVPSNSAKLFDELIALGTFPVMLDLFFKYSWNNFLHTQVENCLVSALKASTGSETSEPNLYALCKHLLVNCKLVERILQAWKDNDEQQAEGKCIRQGYMGHLISIVNKLVELCSSTSLGDYVRENAPEAAKTLDEFKETTLAETNKIQETLLGGVHPNSSIEDNDDFGDIPFPQNNALQQPLYSTYQMQNLSSQFNDDYSGFNDDAFNDGNDTLETINNPSDVNFDLSENYIMQKEELFKQMCAQNISTLFDTDEQIFDKKARTFVIEKQGNKNEVGYNSDSDDESPGDENMDVDPWSSPKPADTPSVISSDPWGVAPGLGNTSGEWADFSSATFESTTYPGFQSAKLVAESNRDNMKVPAPVSESDASSPKCSTTEETSRHSDDSVKPVEEMLPVEELSAPNSAAGDQRDDVESLNVGKKDIDLSEPSIAVEGDTCSLQSPSKKSEPLASDKNKSDKEKV